MLEWEYDRSFWQNTIIMDFNLVCEASNVAHFPPPPPKKKKFGSRKKYIKNFESRGKPRPTMFLSLISLNHLFFFFVYFFFAAWIFICLSEDSKDSTENDCPLNENEYSP
jgi:hypothetical protein